MATDQSIAAKISALLAKAESTEHEGERDLLLAKAAELQNKYAIADELLARSGQKAREQVARERVCEERNTPLVKAKRELIVGLAGLYRCTTVMGPRRAYIEVWGHDSDRAFVLKMFNSLCLQMQTAMARDEREAYTNNIKGWRVSYAHGYVRRVYSRLHAAQAKERQVETPGNALVLADRTSLVTKEMNAFYSDTLKKGRRYKDNAAANTGGFLAGRAAANEADLGGTRVAGSQQHALEG